MTAQLLLALITFAFVGSMTPGPNNLMLMASGANFGFRRTLPHMLGINIGYILMIALVGLGLTKVFDAYPLSYLALKALSTLYLLYLAWKIAIAAPPQDDSTPQRAKPLTFLQAAAFQWVNPKAWAMSLAAISAYTVPESPRLSLLVIITVFWLVNLPTIFLWTMMGTQLRRFLRKPTHLRAFNVTAALLLVATLWPILTVTGFGSG